ncbi:MAG: DUF2804 domain-containing protein [Spirochaetaceae bacterium]|jgi:hypothetical protein|nr:DUF2804 domain-containing protein [Spirochaetaceae bacterium]
MYSRKFQDPQALPIQDGRPVQGSWNRAFPSIDLSEVAHPYPFPLPGWVKAFRIKEWQAFAVQNESYYLTAVLSDIKFYRMARVFILDKETREHLIFKKVIPFGGWSLPRNLYNSPVSSKSYGFFFRIHNWLDAGVIKVDLDIEATGRRPAFTAHLNFGLAPEETTPLAVNLLFSDNRPMYAFKGFGGVRGDMVFGGRHISLDAGKTTGFIADYKGYFPYRMHGSWCVGAGFDKEGRRIGFGVAENHTRENFNNNENILWVDGQATLLPPVRITMPQGPDSDWVIQDVEGMVDLTFTPLEKVRTGFNIIVTHFDYNTPIGCYNGMLLDSGGEEVHVRNLWGHGEKLYLRI